MAKPHEPKGKIGPLRLLAQDADDLAVISAAMQDAIAKVGDISYEPKARLLTVAFNRYCWEIEGGSRVRSALQLGGVLKVQARKIRRGARDAVLEVLAVTFDAGDAPGGLVTISCAGGGDLRAVVECVDAVLADVSEPWPTPRTPAHGD
ncbi:MAG TPA: DUF2948 family protein [Phenylobacterium sp.]|jgi:DNA-binding protein YbaB|nr:DUF2948 family protein [Phenylobacterium sp.]